jgi:hypothetical protein
MVWVFGILAGKTLEIGEKVSLEQEDVSVWLEVCDKTARITPRTKNHPPEAEPQPYEQEDKTRRCRDQHES